MPIVEHDPWRTQYFEHVACPENVFISTDDTDSYALYPDHRWVYNKLIVAESQQIPCAPHGIAPPSFPVFSKPIYNLRGMGMETRTFTSHDEYLAERDPGHMWVELLDGEHLSSDVAVVKGEATWWRHVQGHPAPHQTFDYWTVLAARRPAVESYCAAWISTHLSTYTGMLNLETIGGTIIEVHLRFADQWPDLYGTGWLEALVGLYTEGRWSYDDSDRRDGYSVVLYEAHGARYHHPPSGAGRRRSGHGGHLERADHVSRGSAARTARDAAGRVPHRDRQRLGPRRRARSPRATRDLVPSVSRDPTAAATRAGGVSREPSPDAHPGGAGLGRRCTDEMM